MSRKKPTYPTLRALYVNSGNQCAFPGCTQPLINRKLQYIGQTCHIEAAEPGGERYNPDSDDEERRSYENLLLLCYPHHVETDDEVEFDTEAMRKMKWDHEKNVASSDFKVNESEVESIIREMVRYWDRIKLVNTTDHENAISDLQMDAMSEACFKEIHGRAEDAVNHIDEFAQQLAESDEGLEEEFLQLLRKNGVDTGFYESLSYYDRPFSMRNHEAHLYAMPNWIQSIRMDLAHIRVRYWEEYLKTHSKDGEAWDQLQRAKDEFEEIAKTATHVD